MGISVEDVLIEQATVYSERSKHSRCIFLLVKLTDEDSDIAAYTESMNIHPTSGGEAPLYIPATPSFRIVFNKQSRGPLNCADVDVCKRTLIVSKLALFSKITYCHGAAKSTYGCPTLSFAIPEPTPATKPL